jgi:hypothetical protein
MGVGEAKSRFDDVCKVKYGVKHLKGQPQYVVVPASGGKVALSLRLSKIPKCDHFLIFHGA